MKGLVNEPEMETKVEAPLVPLAHTNSDDEPLKIDETSLLHDLTHRKDNVHTFIPIPSTALAIPSDPVTAFLLRSLKGEKVGNTIKICNIFGKTIATAVGSTAGIPFFRVAQSFAGDYVILGGFLAFGILVAVPAISIWALFDVINDLTPKSIEEKQLTNKRKSKLLNGLRFITIPIAGAILSWPSVYIGYIYNNNSYFLSAIVFANEWTLYSSSVSQLLRKSMPICSRSEAEKVIKKLHQLMQILLGEGHNILINLEPSQGRQILRGISQLVSENRGQEIIYTLLKLTTSDQYVHQLAFLAKYSNPKAKVYYGSYIFPACWSVVAFKVSEEAAQLLSSNPIFQFFMAFVVASLGFVFEGKLVSAAFAKLCDAIIHYRLDIHLQSLARRFSPKTYMLLNAVGITTALLTFGFRTKVALDMLPSVAFAILITPIVITTTIYKASAITSLVNDLIEYTYRQYATSESHDLAIFSKGFTKFLKAFSLASPQAFEHFLSLLDTIQLTQILGAENELVRLLTIYKESPSTEITQPQPSERFSWLKRPSWPSFWSASSAPSLLVPSESQQASVEEKYSNNIDKFAHTSRCVIL